MTLRQQQILRENRLLFKFTIFKIGKHYKIHIICQRRNNNRTKTKIIQTAVLKVIVQIEARAEKFVFRILMHC
jgi:hypothetical protein